MFIYVFKQSIDFSKPILTNLQFHNKILFDTLYQNSPEQRNM